MSGGKTAESAIGMQDDSRFVFCPSVRGMERFIDWKWPPICSIIACEPNELVATVPRVILVIFPKSLADEAICA